MGAFVPLFVMTGAGSVKRSGQVAGGSGASRGGKAERLCFGFSSMRRIHISRGGSALARQSQRRLTTAPVVHSRRWHSGHSQARRTSYLERWPEPFIANLIFPDAIPPNHLLYRRGRRLARCCLIPHTTCSNRVHRPRLASCRDRGVENRKILGFSHVFCRISGTDRRAKGVGMSIAYFRQTPSAPSVSTPPRLLPNLLSTG